MGPSSSSDWATVLLTFAMLWDSEAEITTTSSSASASRASSAPLRFGTRAAWRHPFLGTPAITSFASLIWGTALGLTKLVVSISFTPAWIKAFMTSSFFSVGTNSGQDWNPSLGPTSLIRTSLGISISFPPKILLPGTPHDHFTSLAPWLPSPYLVRIGAPGSKVP